MAEYKSKEPKVTLTVTTTIRGITSLLSSLDEIKLIAERLRIPPNATVSLASNKDGWSDSVTFTHSISSIRTDPTNPRNYNTKWYGPAL